MPMILTPAEVCSAAVVFPTKFLDIQDHHVVLYGDDPFVGLMVPRESIRLRIVQQLRNLTLRLRLHYCNGFDDRDLLMTTLMNLARPLAVELSALLRLAGREVPAEDRTAAIFQMAATSFAADSAVLARLAALRHGEPITDDLQSLFSQLLAALDRFTDCAERLKEPLP